MTPEEEAKEIEDFRKALETKSAKIPLFRDQAFTPEEEIFALRAQIATQAQQLKELSEEKNKTEAKAAETLSDEDRLIELLRIKREQAKRKNAANWPVNVMLPPGASFGGFEENKQG